MRATTARLERMTGEMGAPRTLHPGERSSDQRRRFVARIAAHVTREIANAAGTRLAVRGRLGSGADQIVVAFPWRRQGTAEALGREVPGVLSDLLRTRRPLSKLAADAAVRIRAHPLGDVPSVPDPTIPVVAVTGTNGKTTTVRLLAHIVRSAGASVAYSSTDGVYHDDRLVEEGTTQASRVQGSRSLNPESR